jgi:MFS family permease
VAGRGAGVTSLRMLYAATLAYFTVAGLFLAGLQRFVVEGLGAGETAVGVAVGAFAVSAVVLRPLIGRAIDARGRKPFLIASLVVLLVSSLGFLLAASPAQVVGLRLLQGVAGAAFYTAGTSMVIDLAPSHRRAAAISRFSLFLYAGLALGPTLAEETMRRVGFDATWLLAAGLTAGGLVCTLLLPETRPGGGRGARPPGRRRLVHPAALAPGLVLFLPSISYTAVIGFATLYATELGMATSGLLYIVFSGTIVVVRLLAGGIADRFGNRRVTWPGLAASVVGLALLGIATGPALAVVGVALHGIGFAVIFPALLSLTVAHVPAGERAEALGAFSAFMDAGMGIGGAVVGFVIAQAGFSTAFLATAAGCALSMGALALVPPERPAGGTRP